MNIFDNEQKKLRALVIIISRKDLQNPYTLFTGHVNVPILDFEKNDKKKEKEVEKIFIWIA